MMTETFFEGERALDNTLLNTQVVLANGIKWLRSAQQKKSKVLRYALPDTNQGMLIFTSAKPRYRGLKKGQPATAPDNTLRIDDFAKTIVAGSQPEISLVSGQAFEIVPLVHPQNLDGENKMSLQVLLNGKPIQANIKVIPQVGEARRLSTDNNGLFDVTLDAQGTWVIKAVYKTEQGQDAYSGAYEAAASLLFEV